MKLPLGWMQQQGWGTLEHSKSAWSEAQGQPGVQERGGSWLLQSHHSWG